METVWCNKGDSVKIAVLDKDGEVIEDNTVYIVKNKNKGLVELEGGGTFKHIHHTRIVGIVNKTKISVETIVVPEQNGELWTKEGKFTDKVSQKSNVLISADKTKYWNFNTYNDAMPKGGVGKAHDIEDYAKKVKALEKKGYAQTKVEAVEAVPAEAGEHQV